MKYPNTLSGVFAPRFLQIAMHNLSNIHNAYPKASINHYMALKLEKSLISIQVFWRIKPIFTINFLWWIISIHVETITIYWLIKKFKVFQLFNQYTSFDELWNFDQSFFLMPINQQISMLFNQCAWSWNWKINHKNHINYSKCLYENKS